MPQSYGVHVVAKEGIDALLIEARAFPNSDDLYQRAEKAALRPRRKLKPNYQCRLKAPSRCLDSGRASYRLERK